MEPKEDKMRKCPICSKAFPTKQRLRHHIFIHDPDAKLKCETCGKIFKNSLRLKVHIGSLHTGIKFLGQICRKELSCSTSLRNHMDRIHSAKERPRYPCKFPDCTKSFLNKGHVSDHFKMEHAENPVRFPCFLCWKEFKTRPGLNLHISSHTKEKVYKCKICGKRFGQSPHLSRHEQTHLDIHARKFLKCQLCYRTFTEKSGLRYHDRTFHENKKYPCKLCDASLSSLRSLNHHKKAMHSTHKEKLHSCDKCPYRTWSKGNLSKHVKGNHTKDNQCYFCKVTLCTFSSLVKHCSRVHTLEKVINLNRAWTSPYWRFINLSGSSMFNLMCKLHLINEK